jgi:hypothetical protein
MKPLLKAALGFNAISLIHLVRLQPRLFQTACERAFTAARMWALTRPQPPDLLAAIPEVSLEEIFGDRQSVIRIAGHKTEDGALGTFETVVLLMLLDAESPKEILEIGTFMGYTTRQMAEASDTAVVHTVDLPEDYSQVSDTIQNLAKDDFHLIHRRSVGREYKGRPCSSRIRQHFGDTATWDFAAAGHPTFFFIDGSHTYDYCKSDSEKCFKLCPERGVFLWHDCDAFHPGVVKYLAELRSQGSDVRRIAGTRFAYWKRG